MSHIDQQKARVEEILSSGDTTMEKLAALSYNPDSDRNIVDYILKYGFEIRYIFFPEELLDSQENDFRDFIESENNFYFSAIEDLLDELNQTRARRLKADQAVLDRYQAAIMIWSNLNELYCELPEEDLTIEDFEHFYEVAIAHVLDCAKLLLNKASLKERLVRKYIDDQDEFLISTFCAPMTPSERKSFQSYCKQTRKDLQRDKNL